MATESASTGAWKARPVFVSSTFRDMHAERDWLRNHVFPRLEEQLRQRRHLLEPIDLRLGVETAEAGSEEARELLVLKVCLEEIKRSRPFLIVLLGDRYGWTPPPERMAAAAQEQGFQTDVTGKSVTALEIEFGILKEDPTQKRRSLFFFRRPLPYERMSNEQKAHYNDDFSPDPQVRRGADKLRELKARLRADPELGSQVFEYSASWDEATRRVSGLEAFGELVYEKLWAALEEETRAFAGQPAPTWEEQERGALAEFIECRRRNFTGREELLAQLTELALAPSPAATSSAQPNVIRRLFSFMVGRIPPASASPYGPNATAPPTVLGACITGSAGSGKSALFAELYHRLSQNDSVLLLANAAGATPRGAQVDAMLRRWIQELANALRIRNPLPERATPDDVDNAFYRFLHRASARRRVVVLLDALDQFEPTPRGKYLTWFRPRQWPGNARILATALPGESAEQFSQAGGVQKLQLPPLTLQDAEQIACRVWARYHRQIHPDVVQVLTKKRLADGSPAYGNPLWLTLALEQLNLLDADDFERAERDFTGSPTERMRALLLDTAGRMPADVEGLYGWLLAQTEKVFGLAQSRAFAAVIALSRFGWRDSDLLALVPRVASLLTPTASLVAFSDLQLAALRRGFRAHLVRRGVLGQLDFAHAQMRRTVQARLLADSELVKRIHAAMAVHLEGLPETDPLRESELMVHLIGADDQPRAARLYADLADPSAGLTCATEALARHILSGMERDPNPNLVWVGGLLAQPGLADRQVWALANRFNFDLHDALENTANLRTRRGVLEPARESLKRLAASDPHNAQWQGDLSVSHNKLGDVLVAQGDLAAALREYRAALAIAERLAASDPHNAQWQRDLAVSHYKLAMLAQQSGDVTTFTSELRACFDVLAGMKRRNVHFDPQMQQLYEQLSRRFGG